MKSLINFYSLLVAKRFESLYSSDNPKANAKAPKALAHYRTVRRMLPMMTDGNRMGNHKGSRKKPFYATQGF